MLEVTGLAMFIAPLQVLLINTITNVIVNNFTAPHHKGAQANVLTIILLYLEARFRIPQFVVAVPVTAVIQGADPMKVKELLRGIELVEQQMNI